MAFMSSVFKSGELANCSFVLLALLLQGFGLQQFALNHVIDVNQLVLLGQIAFE